MSNIPNYPADYQNPTSEISEKLTHLLELVQSAFTLFLQKSQASKKTQRCYEADLRHFLLWHVFSLKSPTKAITTPAELLAPIAASTIKTYCDDQKSSGVPTSSTNRRLSALRLFFECAREQGWTATNPAKYIGNMKTTSASHVSAISQEHKTKILHPFARHLSQSGHNPNEVNAHLENVTEFLTWLLSHKSV